MGLAAVDLGFAADLGFAVFTGAAGAAAAVFTLELDRVARAGAGSDIGLWVGVGVWRNDCERSIYTWDRGRHEDI